jgi:replicative DNA helicase
MEKKERDMKQLTNTATALLGLLAYKPEVLAYIADTLRPEMFPPGILQQAAGELWASHEARTPWGAQDLRDFNEDLAARALQSPMPISKAEQAAERLRAGWEARNLADIYQQAARIAGKGDGIGARAHAEGQTELLSAQLARPDEKEASLMRSVAHMEKYFQTTPGNRVTGVDTGFLYLNTFTAGWQPGDINIIAGVPGRGKTTVALQSALCAARMGNAALYFSCGDSTSEQLYLKAAAAIAGIDFVRIVRNKISAAEKGQMVKAYGELHELPIRIYDTSEFSGTTAGIRDVCRRAALAWDQPGLICIDYVQQVRHTRNIPNPVERIEQVSADIKSLAVLLKSPVLLLSQLSRDSVKGGSERRPTNADLRGSGALEQDASRVFFIVNDDEGYGLLATKDRHGGMEGAKELRIPMSWRAEIGRYEWVYDSAFDMPTPAPAHSAAMVAARPGREDDVPF